MTNAEKIEAITSWLESGELHPLTCGNDSGHSVLVPEEENGNVILKCSDCDYTQSHIPPVVLEL